MPPRAAGGQQLGWFTMLCVPADNKGIKSPIPSGLTQGNFGSLLLG